MVIAFGEEGIDDAEVVGAAGDVGEEVADPGTGLASLAEGIGALHEAAGLAEESLIFAAAFEGHAVHALQLGFVVEGFEVADAAGAEDLDDAFGLGGEVGKAPGGGGRGAGLVPLHHPGEGEAAEAAAGVPEEVAAGEEGGGLGWRVRGHRRIRWN